MIIVIKSILLFYILFATTIPIYGQNASITGTIHSGRDRVAYASVILKGTQWGYISDSAGGFKLENIPEGKYILSVSSVGYKDFEKILLLKKSERKIIDISLSQQDSTLSAVVINVASSSTLVRESPVAIEKVSPQQIDRTVSNNIIDVLVKNVPGLQAVKTGTNISKPFIRGLGYNRVLTLYDGLRQEGQQWGDEHGIEVDNYNIDKAEVIKGPVSLMYGSDALAGVVSLYPWTPSPGDKKIQGRILSEYQTNNNLAGNGFRVGQNGDHMLWAVRGSYRAAKNYRNPVDGRVYLTNFSEKNLSALIGFKHGGSYTNFNVSVYDDRQGIPDGSRDSLTRQFTKQIAEGDMDNIKDRPVVLQKELNSYKMPALSQHIQHYRAYMEGEYLVNEGKLDILLGGQQNIRREYNHPTIPSQAGMNVRLNTLNYGLKYSTSFFENTEATVGINGMVQRNSSLDATDFPIPDYHLYDGGIYFLSRWKTNNWTLTGGLRFDVRHIRWEDFYVSRSAVTGFDQRARAGTTGALLQFPLFAKMFYGVSASAGVVYNLNDYIAVKANIGRAYRAPNITELSSNGLDPGAHIIYLGDRSFNPEFSLQEDIGLSVTLPDLSVDLSLFNNNIRNYIFLNLVTDTDGFVVVDAQGNKTYQYQQSKAQLYGGELSFNLHPAGMKGFLFSNNLSSVYGFNRKSIFKGKGVNGQYLPMIPPLQWVGNVSQTIKTNAEFVRAVIPRIGIAVTSAQNRYLGLNGTEERTSGYVLFNGGFSLEVYLIKRKKTTFEFMAENMLNTAYQSNLSRLKYFEYYLQSPNSRTGIYSMGRNISFRTILTF